MMVAGLPNVNVGITEIPLLVISAEPEKWYTVLAESLVWALVITAINSSEQMHKQLIKNLDCLV